MLFVLIAFVLALMPVMATAAETTDEGDLLFRVGGTTTVASGETFDAIVIIDGDAVIDGVVNDTVVLIDGTATIAGTVKGDVNVISGTLNLRQGSSVEDVTLVRSDLNRDQGATVSGSLHERSDFSFGWGEALFSLIFWLGATLLVLAVAFVYAAIGGRHLSAAGSLLTGRPIESFVSALVTWIGLPILAVAAMFTLVGIPIGVTILFVILPVLGLLGYVVTGTRLGAELLKLLGRQDTPARPFLAAGIGLVVFQLFGLIPWIGGLAIVLAGFIGAGALVYNAVRGRPGSPGNDVGGWRCPSSP
jgi:hypothetical protein